MTESPVCGSQEISSPLRSPIGRSPIKFPTIKLQTQSRFLLPHSVTINCLAYKGQLYVSSVYPVGPPRSWNENVMRDPHVRIKIGDKLYDRTLVLVTDPAEMEGVLQVRAKKHPQLKIPANATIHVFHVVG